MGDRSLPASPREREPLGPARRVHRLEGVPDKTLRAAERAGNVETTIKAPEILRGLKRLLECGLREPKRRPEPLELS